ncbi:MAG: S-adenosylmethionine:tRNA ribosyltransferase-isomerase [Actinobacteria bacterium]|nr:S-adenosylmethionine:tRNA ribosyltransferase-isomerase [Actinomycetota bacterium]
MVATRRRFEVPPSRIATSPPEHRDRARDHIRLLVARPGSVDHLRFDALPAVLRAGDLVVVNDSATRPAAIDGFLHARPVVVHLSTALDDGAWMVELRRADGSGPLLGPVNDDTVWLAGGGSVRLLRPAVAPGTRLRHAMLTVPNDDIAVFMAVHGRPITYGPQARRWPLAAYQTVFARRPGSAEMPSAGRPFSHRTVTELVTHGVAIAPITLHAGVSSPERHEPPGSEWYEVPPATAALVRHTHRAGGRVIAVGTTVTRALETVAADDGTVRSGAGWTRLVLSPDRSARVVDALLTGWHEADASHLQLLDAVAGAALVDRAYAAAIDGHYLWHEFGDACLLLPQRRSDLTP